MILALVILIATLLFFGTTGKILRYFILQGFLHFVAYLSIPTFIIVVCFYGK